MADFGGQDLDPFATGTPVTTTRDFQGAWDDTALVVGDLDTDAGTRGVSAWDVPDPYEPTIVTVWDGVVLVDSGTGTSAFLSEIVIDTDAIEGRVPSITLEEIFVEGSEEGFSSITLEEILIGNGSVATGVQDISPCGVAEDGEVGTPCLDAAGTTSDISPEGVPEDSTVGNPCVDVTSLLTAPPPVVEYISPPLGQAVYRYTPVVIRITDIGVPLRRVQIRALFKDRPGWDYIWDGGGRAPAVGFGPNYQGSTNQVRVLVAPEGFEVTVLRDGGWPGQPDFVTYAINALGAEA